MRDYIDTDYLILVSSDGKKAGLEIFRDRIKKNKWPIIDVTRRSVEETAASILKIIEIKKNK